MKDSKFTKLIALLEWLLIMIVFTTVFWTSKSLLGFCLSIAVYALFQLIQIKHNTDK